tara:strand:- start:322 stop:510 length:189 start_codon:yes stop_codon:yes gene_type:complete
MFFKNELAIDHEPSLDYMAKDWADCDVGSGEILNWSHAYENAWSAIEQELEFEGLEIIRIGD